MTTGAFHGAKLVLTDPVGACLLTYLRDDIAHIPFPACWDLPGGGCEGTESPVECALREPDEEFGLRLSAEDLQGHSFASTSHSGERPWIFTGTLMPDMISAIRFGDEGQEWQMMPVPEFIAHPRAIPQFRARVALLLDR